MMFGFGVGTTSGVRGQKKHFFPAIPVFVKIDFVFLHLIQKLIFEYSI